MAHADFLNGSANLFCCLGRFRNPLVIKDRIWGLAVQGFMKAIAIVVGEVFVQELVQAFLAGEKEQAKEFVFQRLKEPLDLAVRLRMPYRGFDMTNAS